MTAGARIGELWTGDEEAYIESNWGRMTDREIAQSLGRTEVSVTSRRAEMRLLRSITGEKGSGGPGGAHGL